MYHLTSGSTCESKIPKMFIEGLSSPAPEAELVDRTATERVGLIGVCHIESVGLIGVCHIERVGLIGVCHIERVGLIGVCHIESVG
jgi:hypothetical protein